MYPSLVFESRCEKTPGATCKMYVRTTAQSDQRFCCLLLGKYDYLGWCMGFETEQASFCLT